MDVVDGVVAPEVGVETEVAGRPRTRLNFKKVSNVMRHIVTKVGIFTLVFKVFNCTCMKELTN